jgi:hypothetical protein
MFDWRIYERDIDVLLAEELYANPEFAGWMLVRSRLGPADAQLRRVDVSLAAALGESDLVATFAKSDGTVVALFIEDKIDAVVQPEQAARYYKRGHNGIEGHEWKEFAVLLCAPRSYLEAHASSGFAAAVSYEDIAECILVTEPTRRGEYRAGLLTAAAAKAKHAYIKQTDAETDRFWEAMFDLAAREYPELEMRRQSDASNTSWVLFRPHDLPPDVHIEVKAKLGRVQLTFDGMEVDRLKSAASVFLPPDMLVVSIGKSAAISLRIDPFLVSEGVAVVATKGRAALATGVRMLNLFREHAMVFGELRERRGR